MPIKKTPSWFVAVSYADGQDEILSSDDYEKACLFAEKVWLDERQQYARTKQSGVLLVEFFDASGRVLWCSNEEPSGFPKTGHIDSVNALLRGKGTGPALGPVKASSVASIRS